MEIRFDIKDTAEFPYSKYLDHMADGGDVNAVCQAIVTQRLMEHKSDYESAMKQQREQDIKLVDPVKIDALIAEAKAAKEAEAEVPVEEEKV